jgi:hypothetical protein
MGAAGVTAGRVSGEAGVIALVNDAMMLRVFLKDCIEHQVSRIGRS